MYKESLGNTLALQGETNNINQYYHCSAEEECNQVVIKLYYNTISCIKENITKGIIVA